MKKGGRGGGGANWNLRDTLTFVIICATWRLYLLWSQSIAHTSRHHRGVPNPLPLFTSRHFSSVSLWQIPFSQQLAASLSSLCAPFCTPFLCFHWFAAS